MTKKLISVLIITVFVFAFTACGDKEPMPESTSAKETSSALIEESETQTTTSALSESTVSESETAESSTTEKAEKSTTAKTTAAAKTTKATTTTKKATTTKAATTKAATTKATTAASTFAEQTTVAKTGSYVYLYDEKTEKTDLKYGVSHNKIISTRYKVFTDGTQEIAEQNVTEVYLRSGYSASYSDLLPAAKENKEKYADLIEEILEIINGYRAEKGIAPLKLNEKLTESACVRAEEMAWSGVHTHTRPNGKSWTTIIKEAGIEKGTAGENLGWGYSTAQAVCQAWKDSETHYENLMNPDFTETGIGIAADADPEKNLCWTQHFITD